MIKTRAALLRQMGLPRPYADSRPLAITPLTLAPPGPGEILVRVEAAGLCHSDLSVIEGVRPRPLPMVLGHEAAGIVERVGDGVGGLIPGDRVVCSFVAPCGDCGFCAEGRPALCGPAMRANGAGTLLGGARRWCDDGGGVINHHLGISGFAQHIVISARSAIKVLPDIDPEIAALFGCAVLTGAGAVINSAHVRPGQSVAVFGLGGVGLASLLGAVACGAYPIIAIDPIEEKRARAIELGASHVFAPGDDLLAQIRDITAGGVEFSFETVGSEAVLADAYAATRTGGTTVTLGLPHPAKMLSIPAISLVAQEKTLRGSYMGSSVPSRDVPRLMGLYKAGRLPVDRLLTHRLPLDDINEGFDRLAAGEAIRQMVIF